MSKNFAGRSKGFKVMSLVLAFVLVVGASVAGTLAWLIAQTATVTNTFTSAELFSDNGSFTLWEHEAVDTDGDGVYTLDNNTEVTSNSYSILPGVNIPKDPTVDVVGLEEHAYLYIKVTSTLPEGLSYSIDSTTWTALGDSYPGVYVYSGSKAENNIVKATNAAPETIEATILTGNQIVVADSYSGTSDDIKLSFDAYMVQATGNGDSAAAAWANTYGARQNP